MTVHALRRPATILLLVVLAVGLSGCAAGPNPEVGTAVAETGTVPGFWYGLWHGVIAPVTFVLSLFTDEVTIYEVHNAGNWYDAGFMLGLTVSLGGGGASSGRR